MTSSSNSPLLGLGRVIAFHRGFVDLTGTVHGALLLSQALYWQGHAKADDGWWHKTKEEWEHELGLSRRYLDSAAKDCQRWLKTELKGMPAITFWQLDVQLLEVDLSDLSTATRQTRLAANAKQDWHETPNKIGSERQTRLAPNANLYIRCDENTDYNTRLHHKITTTTTTGQPVQVVTSACSSGDNSCGGSGILENKQTKETAALIFPSCYKTKDDQLAATTMLKTCGIDAQAVLDVLAAAIQKGEVRKSPGAFLAALVRRYTAGQFDPSPGYEIAKRRAAQATEWQQEEALKQAHEARLERYRTKLEQSGSASQPVPFAKFAKFAAEMAQKGSKS